MKSLIVPVCRSTEETLQKNPQRIVKVTRGDRLSSRDEQYLKKCSVLRIPVEKHSGQKGGQPNGLLVHLRPFDYVDLKAFQQPNNVLHPGRRSVVIALDGIEDPHNLGAIVRTAAFMGVRGLILPKDRSADISESAYRVASGGFEYISVCRVTNLANALEQMKKQRYWVVGLSQRGAEKIQQISIDEPLLLVLGNEERGLRERTLATCDVVARMDSPGGEFSTLNASVAAALAMAWAVNFR